MVYSKAYYSQLNRPASVMQQVLIALLVLLTLIPGRGGFSPQVQDVPANKGQISTSRSNAVPTNTNTTYSPAFGKKNPVNSLEEMPQGLYAAWMQTQSRDAASDSVYQLKEAGTGEMHGRNPAQGLEFSFQAGKVTINGMGLALTGIGYQGQISEPLAVVTPIATENRVEYPRGTGLTEWYINHAEGLEQGFTLSRAWPGENGQELALELSLTGGLFRSAGDRLTMVSDEGSVNRYGGLYAYDATGRLLDSQMEVSEEGQTVQILVKVEGAQYPLVIDPLVQRQILIPGDSDASGFGAAVSLSSDGNTALVGAPSRSINGNSQQGATYIFVRASDGSWSQQGSALEASDGAANDYFGTAVSLSGNGNTALIGTWHKSINGNSQQGAIYVFVRFGTTWTQQQRLTASDGAVNDQFSNGVSLSSDGNTALIGAPYKTINGKSQQGAAYIFMRSNGSWVQQLSLTASDGTANDYFGFAVSLSGDGNTTLIGAKGKNISRGVVYIFVRSGGSWLQQGATLFANGTGPNDCFGNQVSLSNDGNTALIGAAGIGFYNGGAFIFVRSNGSWSQQGSALAASDSAPYDFFGEVLSLSGDGQMALISAWGKNNSQGEVYVFVRGVTIWTQQQILTIGGGSVSLSGNGRTALIGDAVYTFVPTTTLTVNPATQVVYGQTVTLTATVSPSNATGTVVFKDGLTTLNSSSIPVVSGVATYTTTYLAPGNHSLSAIYSGDNNYVSSTSNDVSYQVLATLLIANPVSYSIYNQMVTLTATIYPLTATGTVDFKDGLTTLNSSPIPVVSGVTTFTTSTLITGSHLLSAIYSGDSNYVSSTGSLGYMVYGLIVVVTSSNDDGSGNLVDTFSYALKQANNTPLIITFALVNTNTINFTGPLIPNVPVGVMIDGGSSTCNPTAVVLDGKGVNGNGLVLNGNNFLRNLWVKGFAKSQITASFLNLTPWVKNRLQCFGASR